MKILERSSQGVEDVIRKREIFFWRRNLETLQNRCQMEVYEDPPAEIWGDDFL